MGVSRAPAFVEPKHVAGSGHIQVSADRAFGNQLDAWASGLGDWGECEADDDDDFDEPSAWRDSMALGDCDA